MPPPVIPITLTFRTDAIPSHVLPCAGSIFLCATYGYLLLVGANLISDGSELLLEVSTAVSHPHFLLEYILAARISFLSPRMLHPAYRVAS